MIGRGRSTLFSLSASISYTLAYYFDWPLFRYYPTVNEVHLFPQGPSAGFPILWYGWVATGLLLGAVVAIASPERWAKHIPPDVSWLVAIGLFVAVLVYEKRWFL